MIQLFVQFKKILWNGFRATLKLQKFKVALSHSYCQESETGLSNLKSMKLIVKTAVVHRTIHTSNEKIIRNKNNSNKTFDIIPYGRRNNTCIQLEKIFIKHFGNISSHTLLIITLRLMQIMSWRFVYAKGDAYLSTPSLCCTPFILL